MHLTRLEAGNGNGAGCGIIDRVASRVHHKAAVICEMYALFVEVEVYCHSFAFFLAYNVDEHIGAVREIDWRC